MSKSPFLARSEFRFQQPQPLVLAWLGRRDFVRARATSRTFLQWGDHREFTAERDALLIGYGSAGVRAHRQRVTFEGFERWTRLTGATLDVDALDEYAGHWRWRARHLDAAVIGRFGAPGNPERNQIDAAGAQQLLIRPETYMRWRDDYERSRLLLAPALNVYAAYVVECCLPSAHRARRPAVISS